MMENLNDFHFILASRCFFFVFVTAAAAAHNLQLRAAFSFVSY